MNQEVGHLGAQDNDQKDVIADYQMLENQLLMEFKVNKTQTAEILKQIQLLQV